MGPLARRDPICPARVGRGLAGGGGGGGGGVLNAARRVVELPRQGRQHEAWHAGDEERLTPPEVAVDQPADDVAEGGADRDGGKEHGEHAPALLAREVVREERG